MCILFFSSSISISIWSALVAKKDPHCHVNASVVVFPYTCVSVYYCRSLVTANIEAQVGKWAPPCTLCTGVSTGPPCTGAAAGWNHIKQPSLLHTPFLSSLSTCGNIWNHVGPCGTVWNHMEPYGTMWNQNKHPLYYTNPFCPGSPDYSKFCIFC